LNSKLDSLTNLLAQAKLVHLKEIEYRAGLHVKDSLDLIELQKLKTKDSVLYKKQLKALTRFYKLPASVNLTKLDSAYEAEYKLSHTSN